MFARAGISSRVLRHGETIGGFFGRPKKKKKPKQKFRCYVPFMWSTCVAICGGLTVLCGGTAMCITGYYAKNFTSVDVTNGTHTWQEVDPIPYAIMWNMTYIGPVLMGCGCFAIVVACVVVCETRDKMLRIIEEDEKLGKKTKTKPDFYDLVIKKFKRHPPAPTPIDSKQASGIEVMTTTPSQTRRKSIFNVLMRRSSLKSVKSTKSDFVHIGNALRRIPMQIFAIDMSQSQKTSLLPISLTLGLNVGRKWEPNTTSQYYGDLYLVPKYPSSSCIPDLLKLKDDKLAALFPDMSSWLEDAGYRSPLRSQAKCQYSTPSPLLRPPLGDSRDADDSDLESLCSVTVHVQRVDSDSGPADGATKHNTASGSEDFECYKLPPGAQRMNPNMKLLTNPHAWKTKASTISKSVDAASSKPTIYENINIVRNRNEESSSAPKPCKPSKPINKRPNRRSLLRQKPVTDDSYPDPLTKLSIDADPDRPAAASSEPVVTARCDNSANKGSDVSVGVPDPSQSGTLATSSAVSSPLDNSGAKSPTEPERRASKDSLHLPDDLMKNFDVPVPGIRYQPGRGSREETNRLLDNDDEVDIKHSKVIESKGNVPAKRSVAQLDKDNKTSVFIPYMPTTSSARANSSMERTSPLARSLTSFDPSIFAKMRSPGGSQMTPFTRHRLPGSSHFHFEREGLPPASTVLRKCKTMDNFHESSR